MKLGRPISRVLYLAVIYLRRTIAGMLMRPTLRAGSGPPPFVALFGLAPGGVFTACLSPDTRYALTAPFQPCHSITCFGGVFLLHFPYSCLRRTLSGTLALRSPDFPHGSRRSTQLPGLPNSNNNYIVVNGSMSTLDSMISTSGPRAFFSLAAILSTKLFSVP